MLSIITDENLQGVQLVQPGADEERKKKVSDSSSTIIFHISQCNESVPFLIEQSSLLSLSVCMCALICEVAVNDSVVDRGLCAFVGFDESENQNKREKKRFLSNWK